MTPVVPLSVRAYVDGCAPPTGGTGGTGYVVPDLEMEGALELRKANHQQAEILAAAYALEQIPPHFEVVVVSDSRYVVNGWGWLPGWIGRGWRTKSGQVANPEQWRRLQAAAALHTVVRFEWVKGHADTPENQRADRLAHAARARATARR